MIYNTYCFKVVYLFYCAVLRKNLPKTGRQNLEQKAWVPHCKLYNTRSIIPTKLGIVKCILCAVLFSQGLDRRNWLWVGREILPFFMYPDSLS